MNQLETLLKFLLQMGWKPADFQGKSEIKISEDGGIVLYMYTEYATLAIKIKLRNLVSLESGLWQFCEKNGLCKKDKKYFREKVSKVGNNIGWFEHNYQYRLLESALIPEEELGQFLIDNIKTK